MSERQEREKIDERKNNYEDRKEKDKINRDGEEK